MLKKIDHFDLKQIAESGQCFRWKQEEDITKIVAFNRVLRVREKGDAFDFDCDEKDFDDVWADYFDLGTDYNRVEELVKQSKDSHLIEAYRQGSGIRILRQELFETIISYLISQNNNIPRIKGSLEAICKKGGFKIEGSNEYRLPAPGEISKDFFFDSSLSLGYRDSYLSKMYEFLADNPNYLDSLRKKSYPDAKEELRKHTGIGPKVSDCICLFSLHHIAAFPIDTHVKQLLNKYYQDGFNYEYFDGFAGVIQQYLFYYELKNK